MATAANIVWAMIQREFHKNYHFVEMSRCTKNCVTADILITEDHKRKQNK